MFVWMMRCLPKRANKWIQRRVILINQSIKVRQNRLKHFLEHYLESDGIFMIRMIANNTSDYVATDLIHNLWCQHAENYDQLFPNDPHNIADIPCMFQHSHKDLKEDTKSTCTSGECSKPHDDYRGGGAALLPYQSSPQTARNNNNMMNELNQAYNQVYLSGADGNDSNMSYPSFMLKQRYSNAAPQLARFQSLNPRNTLAEGDETASLTDESQNKSKNTKV